MKVVILAGGFGTRITEESYLRPKPMIEIGGQPILWHIMKYYSSYGFHDFVICLGYKQYVVKEYFADYFLHTSDVTFDLANNSMEVLRKHAEPWKVTLIDTGDAVARQLARLLEAAGLLRPAGGEAAACRMGNSMPCLRSTGRRSALRP